MANKSFLERLRPLADFNRTKGLRALRLSCRDDPHDYDDIYGVDPELDAVIDKIRKNSSERAVLTMELYDLVSIKLEMKIHK